MDHTSTRIILRRVFLIKYIYWIIGHLGGFDLNQVSPDLQFSDNHYDHKILNFHFLFSVESFTQGKHISLLSCVPSQKCFSR